MLASLATVILPAVFVSAGQEILHYGFIISTRSIQKKQQYIIIYVYKSIRDYSCGTDLKPFTGIKLTIELCKIACLTGMRVVLDLY